MEGNKKEKNVRQYVLTEVKFIILIASILTSILVPFYMIKTDIALIQKDIAVINTNHLSHLQNYAEEITELKKADSEQQAKYEELLKIVIQNQTLLKSSLGIK